MVATPLSPTSRYIPPGYRQYYYVPTIADKNAPTRPELDAGTDLTAEIGEVKGFAVTSDTVDAPDMGSRFTSQVPGMTSADKSSISLYTSTDSDDVRTLLPRDTKGFIVIFPEGDNSGTASTNLMDVFPITVSSASIQPDMDKPGMIELQFTVTSEPVQNLAIPST